MNIARNVSITIWIVYPIRSRKSWFDRKFRIFTAYYYRLKRLSSTVWHANVSLNINNSKFAITVQRNNEIPQKNGHAKKKE